MIARGESHRFARAILDDRMAQLVLRSRGVRGVLLLVITCACGARTELSTPPDASAPTVDAATDVETLDVVAVPDVTTQTEPTVIVTTDVPAYALTVDDKNVYWTQGYWPLASAPSLPLAMQCEKTKCEAPLALATGTEVPLSIAVDHDNVYWTDGSPQWDDSAILGLFACAIGGCAQKPQTLVAGPAHGVSAQDGRLFWVDAADIAECAAGSCATQTPLGVGTGSVKSDGSYAYWSTDTSIMRCVLAPTGCVSSPAVVVSDAPSSGVTMTPSFRTFALDSTNVYWLSHGELRRCPKAGCSTPITIMPDDNTAAQCIATDGINVYWTAPNALVRCPVTGCAKPIPVYVSYEHSANCVALDETNIYWTTGPVAAFYNSANAGSIMTMPK
jgi:hypothetical protein